MKTCKQCRSEKPLTEFYIHKAMADGYLNQCKPCVKSTVSSRRNREIESVRAYDRERGGLEHRRQARREYDLTEAGIAARKKAGYNWASNHRNKKNSHLKVHRAIISGELKKLPCERCGVSDYVEAHHEDYSKPLEVVWLCDHHHKERHKELREIERSIVPQLTQAGAVDLDRPRF